MILIFDCTLTDLHIGLSQNNSLISSTKISLKKSFSKFMVKEIKNFLQANATTFKEIKIVYFTTGPGSFTSVRLGVVFAKTLAICHNIKIYTLDSLSAFTNIKNGVFTIKATNQEYFCGEFTNYLLSRKIYLTTKPSLIQPVDNIMQNMLNKIYLAKKWDDWKDLKISYGKKI